MFDVNLYNTNSPNNALTKNLENETRYKCSIKRAMGINILEPVLYIKSDTMLNFNYAYIPDFKRYYFINKIEIAPNNIYALYLSIDVLMTYKDEILKCNAHIIQKKPFEDFYNSNLKNLENYEYEFYELRSLFNAMMQRYDKYDMYIVTIGG